MQLITIVDDEAEHKRICDLATNLHQGVDCLWVQDLRSFHRVMEELSMDLVCYWMTGGRPAGISTWTKLADRQPNARVILLDRKPSRVSQQLAGKIGAVEVVTQSNLSQLTSALKREIKAVAGADRGRKTTRAPGFFATQVKKALNKVRKPHRDTATTGNPRSGKVDSAKARGGKVRGAKADGGKARSVKARSRKTDSAKPISADARSGKASSPKADSGTARGAKARTGKTGKGRALNGAPRVPARASNPPKRAGSAKAPTVARAGARTPRTRGAKDWKPKADKSSLPALVNHVNEALEKDKFELVYQPIMHVKGDSVDNYEVFIRLPRGKKLLLPQQFFPQAEKYGLMTAIDCWVVEHAIAKLNQEEDQRLEKAKRSRVLPRKVRFFINISGYSLVDKTVLSKLVKTMVAAKASPERIVLDVDERTVLSRLANARMLNRNIKKLKLEFALNHYTEEDDLLNYLKYMSIDYVKLKSDLIEDVEQDRRKQKAVNLIVARAQSNGIKTMACTVESMATMSYLYQIGVDYLQGYAIADPGRTLRENVFSEMM